jgi:hypothetical protein
MVWDSGTGISFEGGTNGSAANVTGADTSENVNTSSSNQKQYGGTIENQEAQTSGNDSDGQKSSKDDQKHSSGCNSSSSSSSNNNSNNSSKSGSGTSRTI